MLPAIILYFLLLIIIALVYGLIRLSWELSQPSERVFIDEDVKELSEQANNILSRLRDAEPVKELGSWTIIKAEKEGKK